MDSYIALNGNPITGYNQEYWSAIIEQIRLCNDNIFIKIKSSKDKNNYSSVKRNEINYKVQDKNGN